MEDVEKAWRNTELMNRKVPIKIGTIIGIIAYFHLVYLLSFG